MAAPHAPSDCKRSGSFPSAPYACEYSCGCGHAWTSCNETEHDLPFTLLVFVSGEDSVSIVEKPDNLIGPLREPAAWTYAVTAPVQRHSVDTHAAVMSTPYTAASAPQSLLRAINRDR